MDVELVEKGNRGYHNLFVDGELIGSFFGRLKVTGTEVAGLKQVTIGGNDTFLWVNKILGHNEEETRNG